MITEIQQEVAIHLLANAIRKTAGQAASKNERQGPPPSGSWGRRNPDEAYLRGMVDMLNGLVGRALADDMYREAVYRERGVSIQ